MAVVEISTVSIEAVDVCVDVAGAGTADALSETGIEGVCIVGTSLFADSEAVSGWLGVIFMETEAIMTPSFTESSLLDYDFMPIIYKKQDVLCDWQQQSIQAYLWLKQSV